MHTTTTISDFIGKTFTTVRHQQQDDDQLIFLESNQTGLRLYHAQSCCEQVYIEDIEGDLQDLVDTPILEAEEVQGEILTDVCEYAEWTFYKFATIKGRVTIRWCGKSNGYYSVSVNIESIEGVLQ